MNILIIYDSKFGNTQKVAQGIAKSFTKKDKAQALHLSEAKVSQISKADLVFIGSPTHGGQATPNTNTLINQIVDQKIPVKFACFDTRFSPANVGFGLKLLMSVIGYASPKMAKALAKNTAGKVVGETGFIVMGKEGPLASGEIKRVQDWAKSMAKKL